ncbi:MAG: DUF190 domain-containing protein [Nitrospirota bacterium]
MPYDPKRMKKVEIVIEAVKLQQVLKIIDQAGASGYTVHESVTGRGHRGYRRGGGVSDLYANAMIITLVDENAAVRIAEEVRDLIQDYAGVMMISDVDVVWPDYDQDQ